ncbi:glycosyl transferase [Zopfochytrium polystomum]|nr:glycosyl transferase [Zopfochytrium polystomum]
MKGAKRTTTANNAGGAAPAVNGITIALLAILTRWAVSLGSHSGMNNPPMFGDFEAQRHWLEITLNLPTTMWYRYELQYWGLDYPPLTAYHSWVLGKIAHLINPSWVELDASRGLETPDLRAFMRYTAIITDLAIHFTAAIAFCHRCLPRRSPADRIWMLTSLLLQPALIVIDHGHFQYNSAMLGFTLWAVVFFLNDQFVLGSIMFCLSLNFKQMALFYALPVFFFLLGKCVQKGPFLLIKLGVTVVATFAICLLPFLTSVDDLLQVFKRVFPVERGLYEDKVANVWCAVNIVVKLRQMFDVQKLAIISAAATLVSLLPSGINVFLRPTRKRLLFSLVNGSLSFFLFSFQVHEKSILLPLLPASLLLLEEPIAGTLFINVAVFSMLPLLKRDGLVISTFAATCLFNIAIALGRQTAQKEFTMARTVWFHLVLQFAVVGMLSLVAADQLYSPPERYPDLHVVANCVFSCALFLGIWAWYNVRQLFLEEDGKVDEKGKVGKSGVNEVGT